MQIEIVKEEDGRLELLMREADIGLANLICERLLDSKAVTFAGASYDHPMIKNVKLKIVAKNPRKELKRALEAIAAQLSEARQF